MSEGPVTPQGNDTPAASEASSGGGAVMSPYATGGGGVTFERKVAAGYLARMLADLGSPELGEGRSIVSVGFQQAPKHWVDDLVIRAKRADEAEPSLVLALAVRREPSIVTSDEKARKLIGSLMEELATDRGADVEQRVGLVGAGQQTHATELAVLADLARGQSEADAFFTMVQKPGRFERPIRDRLKHLQALVKLALQDAAGTAPNEATVAERTWLLLSSLDVLMPRYESPDESDWAGVTNDLIAASRSGDLPGATLVRDRLAVLAAEYGPKAAVVDLDVLRRDTHHVIASTIRRQHAAWQALDGLHERAVAAVRSDVASADGNQVLHLDRNVTITEIRALAAANPAVIVHGESGVGKSALLIEAASLANDAEDESQVLVINLRHLPGTAIELDHVLGAPLATVLAEMSASERLLIIDGADAAAEGNSEQLLHLVDAALKSEVHVIALTTNDNRKVLHDTIAGRCSGNAVDYEVPPLTDEQIDGLVTSFPELSNLAANVHARELLRRLVVVDLLIRGGVSGLPLTDGDAMEQVWSDLVRRHGPDGGTPDARDAAMLRLADLALTGADPLAVVATLDTAAVEGLRRDGLLRTPANPLFRIGPEFAHDEVRRYAVARLLLTAPDPTVRLVAAGVPRWSLSAARLACQLYLQAGDSTENPASGRFGRLQKAFDGVVDAGHGERWADVPSEALLALAEPGALLADAWADLSANGKTGLHRLCRLVDQRHREASLFVRVTTVEPLIKQLLDGDVAWLADKQLRKLVLDWLRALVFAKTPAGDPHRTHLRSQLVARCDAADRAMREEQAAAEAARVARTPEEIERDRLRSESPLFRELGFPRSRRRRRPEVPREITDEVMVELLALLGPDLGDEGEAILRRVATEAPAFLGPAVEGLMAGHALATRPQGFLAAMTEAYYLDEDEDGSGFHEDGIRRHDYHGLGAPHAASYYGPFMVLLQSDFRGGVRALNRMLNHAALARARTLASIGYYDGPVSDEQLDQYRTTLYVTGAPHVYVGDPHVWVWYRGTGVGPYPCMSALQALERVCDQLIEVGLPLGRIIPMLLDGCENLAMLGLVVGLIVRHLDKADGLLDPYLCEPMVWHHEFGRLGSESSGFAARSDGITGADRRGWSFRQVSMVLALSADGDRADELRQLGQALIDRAEEEIRAIVGHGNDAVVEAELVKVRSWASGLDRDLYSVEATDDNQLVIQSTPPTELVEAVESGSVDLRRGQEAIRLSVEYYINPKKGTASRRSPETLAADLETARQLIEEPPALNPGGRWDAPAAVIAAALEAHLLDGVDLPEESLRFAVETIVEIAGLAAHDREYDSEESYFEQGADRVAAGLLPLLLSPAAEHLRVLIDRGTASEVYARINDAAHELASALPNEVRVHLGRGLDHLWQAPCASDGSCHHEVALDLILATMRDCAFGAWDPETGRRYSILLEDPVAESLEGVADDAIDFRRLDAALRALALASTVAVCVSDRAKELFTTVLGAHRRALLAHERYMDDRGTHTLVAARALLTLISNGDDSLLFEHLDAYADRSDLLNSFISALCAAGEESEVRAVVAARIWPKIVTRVLSYEDGHEPFDHRHHGDYARAALIPNAAGEVAYLYRELEGTPIVWWDPVKLSATVDEWLPCARGYATCLDHLVRFVRAMTPADQVRLGLPWIADLVFDNPEEMARRSYLVASWQIDIRPAVSEAAALATWQRMVDALVVAGESKLAPYSE